MYFTAGPQAAASVRSRSGAITGGKRVTRSRNPSRMSYRRDRVYEHETGAQSVRNPQHSTVPVSSPAIARGWTTQPVLQIHHANPATFLSVSSHGNTNAQHVLPVHHKARGQTCRGHCEDCSNPTTDSYIRQHSRPDGV